MKPVLTHTLAALCASGVTSAASAQYLSQGAATWRWEASLDGGASWQGGVVEAGPSSEPLPVLVRAVVSFETFGATAYLGGATLDPFVTTSAWQAGGDTITSITLPHGTTTQLLTWDTSPVRLPGLLKVEYNTFDDPLPPGAGPGWTRAAQAGYQTIFQPIYDNPMVLMGFSMVLDGTPGDRTAQAVFYENPNYPNRPLFVETRPWQGFGYVQTLTQEPVTIRIVPAPPAVALGVVALVFGGRRRR